VTDGFIGFFPHVHYIAEHLVSGYFGSRLMCIHEFLLKLVGMIGFKTIDVVTVISNDLRSRNRRLTFFLFQVALAAISSGGSAGPKRNSATSITSA